MRHPVSLRGAGGDKAGGGSQTSYAPTEVADSLRSKAFARVIDLVSEGEIYGPVNQYGNKVRNAVLGAVTLNGSGGITAIAVTDGGFGYADDVVVTLTDAADVTPTLLCVANTVTNAEGTIVAIKVNLNGAGYSAAVVATVIGSVGLAVFLDGIPLVDSGWQPSFTDVTLDYRLGTQVQEPLTAFPSGESTTNYGIEFKKSLPFTFLLDEPNADKVVIGVMVPQLYRQLKVAEGGDLAGSLLGTTVSYVCYIRYSNENTEHAEELFFQDTISGKAASAYIRATQKKLPRDLGAEQHRWHFRLVRLSNDEVSVSILNKTRLEFVTVLTTEKLTFPLSALFGVEVNAEQFRSVPSRSYELKLLLIQVPSNYFPSTRLYNRGVVVKAVTAISRVGSTATVACAFHGFIDNQVVTISGATPSEYNGEKVVTRVNANSFTFAVSGSPATPATGTLTARNLISSPVLDGATLLPASLNWDGSFYVAWSDNYAWCFYDLVMNRRYGTGEHTAGYYGGLDKWTTYLIGKVCDEMVPNGYGGVEPRFTCNLYLQTPEDAFKVLNDMASGFRSMIYWANGQIVPVQDTRKDPIQHFTNASVMDGMFTYSGTGKKARHTVALVRYNDARDAYKPKPEYVDDLEGILRYGVQPIEISAFGCTSRGQAYRQGLLTLMTERTNTETVTFRTGLEAGAMRPGDVFKVSDRHRSGLQYAGRVLGFSEDFLSIRLDRKVQLGTLAYTATFAAAQPFFTPLSTTANDTVADVPAPYRMVEASSQAEAQSARTAQIIEQRVISVGVAPDGNLLLNFQNPLSRTVVVTAATSAGLFAVITAVDHGLFSEQQAKLSGCNLDAFNGLFPVKVLTKDTFEIELYSVPPTATATTMPRLTISLVHPGAVWGLECADAKAEQYRLLNVEAVENGVYEIVGLEYHPEIYAAVDALLDFDPEPPSALQSQLLLPKPPAGLTGQQNRRNSGYRVSLDWEAPEGSLISSYYVYYRQGLNNFSFYTEVHNTQVDVDLDASDDYTFRVISVGPSGQTSQASELEMFVGDAFTTAAYDRITGLELQGGEFESEFLSPSPTFVWRKNSRVNVLEIGNEEAFGAEFNGLPADTSFAVALFNPVTRLQIYPPSGFVIRNSDSPWFTFDYATMNTGKLRDFIFEVRLRQTVNSVAVESKPERIRVTNPRPAVSEGVTFRAVSGSLLANISDSVWLLPDFSKLYVWVSSVPSFNLSAITPLELVSNSSRVLLFAKNASNWDVRVTTGNSYYVRYALADVFATDKLDTNISDQFKISV